jgi:hypothetical protein
MPLSEPLNCLVHAALIKKIIAQNILGNNQSNDGNLDI